MIASTWDDASDCTRVVGTAFDEFTETLNYAAKEFEEFSEILQEAIVLNRVQAQAVLGNFEPIAIPVIISLQTRKINRRNRYKRYISVRLIILMIALILMF